MRNIGIVVGIACGVSFLVACPEGGSSGSGDTSSSVSPAVKSACEAVAACQGSTEQMDCESVFGVLSAPAGCLDAVETASCEDHAADNPDYADTCFPSCDNDGERTCNDDGTLTLCQDISGELRRFTLDCSAVCEFKGYRFSGTCGPDYLGQTSEKGIVCWCIAASGGVGLDG